MTFTLTANYAWKKPDVGSETNIWGGDVNTNYDNQDSTVFAVSGVANAALPKAGGVMTGRQDQFTTTGQITAMGNVSGNPVNLDLSVSNYKTMTVVGNTTFAMTNVPATATAYVPLMLRITNGGAFTLTWPVSVKWPSGTPATFTASGTDLVAFISDDAGTTWRMAGLQKALA